MLNLSTRCTVVFVMGLDRRSERKLIERAVAGDRDASAEIIRVYQPSLYAFMLRMTGRPDVAEDITQDAFVRVLTNLERFDPKFRFSTWLFTIAKRLHMNAVAKSKPVFDTDLVGSVAPSTNFDSTGDWTVAEEDEREASKRVLAEALEALPAEQREIVVLFHQMDWPISRISAYLKMPEGTIKSHLHRGRRRLREAIERSTSRQAAAVCEELLA